MPGTIVVEALSAVRWDEETGVYLGWVPGLNLYSQGTTEDEAFKAVESALALFGARCIEKGILEPILIEAGFRKVSVEAPNMRLFTARVTRKVVDAAAAPFEQFTPLVSSLAAAAC
jgi:predicted RNase H-like HicB family nuclease